MADDDSAGGAPSSSKKTSDVLGTAEEMSCANIFHKFESRQNYQLFVVF